MQYAYRQFIKLAYPPRLFDTTTMYFQRRVRSHFTSMLKMWISIYLDANDLHDDEEEVTEKEVSCVHCALIGAGGDVDKLKLRVMDCLSGRMKCCDDDGDE